MSTPTWVGRRLSGRFILDELVAENDLIAVYRGRDREGRPVAATLLRPHLVASEGFRPRFEREARAVAQLRHPAIVPVLDFGVESDTGFLVAGDSPGGSLAARLKGRPLPPAEAARIVTAVGAALTFAASRGVIHRSLTSSQVLFDANGRPTVGGFGLAAIVADDGQFGDVHYLSPEQVRGQPGDERSDVYSFGVVAYEAITGRVPFPGAASLNVMLAVLNEPPPPPQNFNPNVPPGWIEPLTHALAKSPNARYQSAGDLAASLGPVDGAGPEPAPPPTRSSLGTMVEVLPPEAFGTVVEPAPPPTRPVASPSLPPQPRQVVSPSLPPLPPRSVTDTPPGPSGPAPDLSLPPSLPVRARRGGLTPLIYVGVAGLVLVALVAVAALAVALYQGGGATPQPTAPPVPTRPALPAAEGMVQVPAGTYPLGVDNPDPDHAAARTVDLPAFWLDQFEVTNAEYAAYVESHGAPAPYGWQGESYPAGEDRYPVRGVTFDQASAYCDALGKRLPQEAEWEAAARGPEGRLFPWGDDPNAVKFDPTHTHPVGSVPENVSAAGVYDLADNVWEWVAAPYDEIPTGRQLLRGGSYNFLQDMAYRLPVDPAVLTGIADAGFRCAASAVR